MPKKSCMIYTVVQETQDNSDLVSTNYQKEKDKIEQVLNGSYST